MSMDAVSPAASVTVSGAAQVTRPQRLIKAKPSGVAREFEAFSVKTEWEIFCCVEGIGELLGWVDAQIDVAEKARGKFDVDG